MQERVTRGGNGNGNGRHLPDGGSGDPLTAMGQYDAAIRTGDLFRLIAEESDEMIVAFGPDFSYAYINPATERLLGPRDTILGRVLWDVAPHSVGTSYAAHYRRAMTERIPLVFEEYYPPRDTWNYIRVLPADNGGIVVFARDTTAQHRADLAREDALQSQRQGDERHRRLVELLPDALFVNHNGRIAFANPAFLRLVGATGADDALGRPVLDFFAPQEHRFILERVRRMMEADEAVERAEERIVRLDGTPVSVEVAAVPYAQDGERLIQVVLRDLTDQKRRAAEDAARAGLMPALFDATPDAVFVKGRDGRYLLANPAASVMMGGLPVERIVGRTDEEIGRALAHPEAESIARAVRAQDRRVLEGGTAIVYDLEVPAEVLGTPEGRIYRVTKAPFRDAGDAAGVIAVAREVTGAVRAEAERRASDAALRASEERYRLLTLATSKIVWWTDADGAVVRPMPSWEAFTGQTWERHRGDGWLDAVHPDDRALVRRVWAAAVENGASYECPHRIRRHDGRYRYVHARGVPLRGENGAILEWVGASADVTEKVEEEQRRRFLAELSERTRALTDPDAIIAETARAVGEFLGLLRFQYAAIDDDDDDASGGAEKCATRAEWSWGRDIGRTVRAWPLADLGDGPISDLRAGRPVVIRDAETDPRTAALYPTRYAPHDVRASVRVPIRVGGKWTALLSAQTSEPRDWSPEEVGLLEGVADKMRLALENARLLRSLRESEAQQRRVAETLQRSLLALPDTGALGGVDVWAHYEGASDEAQIGGDWYDAFRLDGGRVALCLGDVTGHGTEAALFTADLKFSLRAYLRESDGDIAAALRRLNDHVLDGQRLDDKPENVFVCVSVAVLTPATGDAAFGGAGMEWPLLLRSASGEARPVRVPTGPILGALPGWDGGIAAERLAPGDVVLLYTDGLSEARRGKGADFFGPEGVARAFADALRLDSLEGIAGAVVADAKRFGGGTLGDDVCLLLARLGADQ